VDIVSTETLFQINTAMQDSPGCTIHVNTTLAAIFVCLSVADSHTYMQIYTRHTPQACHHPRPKLQARLGERK
jgi:hypothetical protein